MVHPYVSMMTGRERCREALAVAERRRLARQARDATRAARSARRVAGHGSGVRGLRRVSRVLLRGAR